MKLLTTLTLLALAASCENPYPDAGEFKKNQRAEQRDPGEDFSCLPPSNITFTEGITNTEKFKIITGNSGHPMMEIEGELPFGATFDDKTFHLEWTPSYIAGNDVKDPTIKSRIYPIKVYCWNSNDRTDRRGHNINLIVNDYRREFLVNAQSRVTVTESYLLDYLFEIESLDYPDGPFNVSLDNFPANTKLEKISEKKFRVLFSPDYHHVKRNSDGYSIDYKSKITVTNPALHKANFDVEIQVRDRRVLPKIVVPKASTQGLDATFQISAFDPNGEVAPEIKLVRGKPQVGDFTTKLIKDYENNRSVLNVKWSDIPPSFSGKDFSFRFEACSYVRGDCSADETEITIEVKERKAPIISRKNWESGTIKYLGHKQDLMTVVDVEDGDGLKQIQKIEIQPASMREHVIYQAGQLKMNFSKQGIYQFNLVATSIYNLQSSESFVVEVFSENRSEVLYFTDSTRDKEATFFKQAYLTQGIELLNPELQALNERNISGRKSLVLGTSILLDPNLTSSIELAMTKVENIIIASPLLGRMPKKFLDELAQDYGITLSGRYKEITEVGKPSLSTMNINGPSVFGEATTPVLVSQDATSESSNPLIFKAGVSSENCKNVFQFSNSTKTKSYNTGVVCNRVDGKGRIAILGTEFADLKPSAADKGLPFTWFDKMLTAKLTVITIE